MSRFSRKKAALVPVLLLLVALLSLLYSTQLLRWTLSFALPSDGSIRLTTLEGSLAEGLVLRGLKVEQPQLTLAIDELAAKIDLRCLARLELCLTELSATGLDVKLAEASTQPSEPSETLQDEDAAASAPEPLALPAIRVQALHLRDIHLQQGAFDLKLASLQSAIATQGDKISIRPTRLGQLRLHLPDSPAQSHTSSSAWWQYQAPKLARLPIPVRLELGVMELDQLQLTGMTELALQSMRLQLDATPNALVLHQLSATYQHWAIQGQARLTNTAPFALQAQVSLLSAEQQLDTRLSGSLEQLDIVAKAKGSQQAELTASLNLLQQNLPLSAQLQVQRLQWPLQGAADYRLIDSRLSAEGSLTDLVLELQAQGQSPQTGEADLTLEANFKAPKLNWSRLQLNSDQGKLQSQGQLDLTEQSLAAQLATTELQLAPWLPDYPGSLNASLQLSAAYQQQKWQLDLTELTASGTVRQQPLQLQGQLNVAGQQLQISKFETTGLVLQHGSNQLTAKGQLTDQWQLQLQLDAADLSQSVQAAKGRVTGLVQVSGPQLKPRLQLDLQGEQLRYQRDYRMDSLALSGTLDTNQWQHQLDLQLGSGRLAGEKLNSAQLVLHGDQQQSAAALQLDTELLQAQLQLQAKAEKNQLWLVQMTQAQLASPVGNWVLKEASSVELDPTKQRLRLSAQCWQSNPAELCLQQSNWLSASHGAVKLNLEHFELAQLQHFIADEQRLSGEASLTASAQWKTNQPLQATLEVTGSKGHWQQTQINPLLLPWQQWSLSATLASNKLSSTTRIQFTDSAKAQLELSLPDVRQQDLQLAAQLELQQLDLSLLQSLLPDQTEFAATLNGKVDLSGQLSKPKLAGQVRLTDVSMRGVQAPMDIDQAELLLQLNQHSAQLSGQLKSGQGNAELSGFADWFDLVNYQARLALTGQQLPVNLPQGQLVLSPQLTLLAQNSSLAVQGTVQVPQAHLAIDDLPASAVQLSDDEVILNKDLEVRRAAEQSSLKLSSDIRLVLGEQVKLQAFGLKSRLKGQLLFSQRGANQSLKGEVNLLDGTFRSYGQDLQIRKGKLVFNGPVDQPYLNIEAIRNPDNTEDDVIAGIRVTGPADAASASIFSQPGKPQANALSYLLTGRDLTADAAGGNPLTTSLIGMGIANSGALVSSVGEALGFEQVTLDTKGSGDNSQVTVSGYLSPKLQLKYGVGIFNSLGEFTLRYELMKSLYLEAVRGLDNAVDLLYKFEFD
ncbi:translocation/assembly module TamB domain-containing protein [Rheinheimera marina]|uniref:Translocation/assembly module TamB domain-containing protein n=1 Tax=Rheinheimera marina TaxID=1774958 RepID=A0ABV9JQS8_9GAMM